MSKKYIVFDLDGTLIDTVPDILFLLNGLLKKRGYNTIASDKGKYLLGLGSHYLIEKACDFAGIEKTTENVESLCQEWMEIYSNAPMDNTCTFKGVYDTLDLLKKSGCHLAICTNKPPQPTAFIVDKLNLRPYFDVIFDADSLPKRKPDPFPLLEAIRQMGGKPDQAVMVGDSEPDAKAAENARFPFILMTYGYALTPANEIPAVARIDDFSKIPELLKTL